MTSRANMASTTAAATVVKLSGHKGLNDLVVRRVCVCVWRQYRPHVVKLWQAAAAAAAFQPSQGMRLNWLWPVQFLCVLATFIFAIFSSLTGNQWNTYFMA